MKVVIAGSRGLDDYLYLDAAIKDTGFVITEVVSGGAGGVDSLGERWAEVNGIPLNRKPADWNRYAEASARTGRSNPAGMIRNREMAEYCDAAVIIWDGVSPGTKNMIAEMARFRNKPCQIFTAGKLRLLF